MRERPTNVILAVLAACILTDISVAKMPDGQHLILPMGLVGALVLRALSKDPQPIVLTAVGVALTGFVLAANHQLIDGDSGWYFALMFLLALLYALWEKFVNWLPI